MIEERDVMDVATGAEPSDEGGRSEPAELPSHIDPQSAGEASQAPESSEIVHGEQSGLSQDEIDRLTADIVAALKTVFDPEIPVDIYELGLIYKVDIEDNRHVAIDMTLTAPGCPVAGEMPIWVEGAVGMVEGVSGVTASMVFDPPWDMSRMSDEARVALNMW